MKIMLLAFVLLGIASTALAVDREQLDDRVRALTAQFDALQKQPERRVPAEILRRAKGIILLNRTKAGFMFVAGTGSGVAMVKDKSGDWSPVAFIRSNEGSFGFQAGGEQDFCVMLLMTANATHRLMDPTIQFGNEVRGTAGNNSEGAEKKFNADDQSVRIYSERSGFYGGIAFKGVKLSADRNANEIYYDRFVTLRDILFDHKVANTETSRELARKISGYSRP